MLKHFINNYYKPDDNDDNDDDGTGWTCMYRYDKQIWCVFKSINDDPFGPKELAKSRKIKISWARSSAQKKKEKKIKYKESPQMLDHRKDLF